MPLIFTPKWVKIEATEPKKAAKDWWRHQANANETTGKGCCARHQLFIIASMTFTTEKKTFEILFVVIRTIFAKTQPFTVSSQQCHKTQEAQLLPRQLVLQQDQW